MSIVFGPVVSRRFGYSLGIDLSPNEKSCNFDCIYCELSKSKTTTKIKNPPNVKDVIVEIKKILDSNLFFDVITITANGEPTLYEDLDLLIDELNKIKKEKKLLILSNGSTIMDERVQNSLKKIDIVKLSLDSVDKKTFKKIDRAYKGIEVEDIINGIKNFRRIFDKELIIEILVVEGINDTNEEMIKLNDILNQIKPNRVDLGTIDRPPAYNVSGVGMETLIYLSNNFSNLPLNIAYKRDYKNTKLDLDEDEILATLKRRPLSKEEIDISFSNTSKQIFKKLLENKLIKETNVAGILFFKSKI